MGLVFGLLLIRKIVTEWFVATIVQIVEGGVNVLLIFLNEVSTIYCL